MKKILAFTLAETLIVMGIIGVISALTLPNLNQSTGDKEKVAKIKKIYQNLNDAYGRAVAVYGPYDEWFVNDGNNDNIKIRRAGDRLTEFMKLSKNCKMTLGCFTSGSGNWLFYEFILADGTSVKWAGTNSYIDFDIDGLGKGKNRESSDQFVLYLNEHGFYPDPINTENDFKQACSGKNGPLVTSWAIKYDNLDVLKVGSDCKCPNGTVLTYETVTSCY